VYDLVAINLQFKVGYCIISSVYDICYAVSRGNYAAIILQFKVECCIINANGKCGTSYAVFRQSGGEYRSCRLCETWRSA